MAAAEAAWDAMTPRERRPLERQAERWFGDLPWRAIERYAHGYVVTRLAERIAAGRRRGA